MSNNKIPTTEDFIVNSKPGNNDEWISFTEVQTLMIKFAKLHVKAALEAALEDSPHGSSTDIPSYEDMKESILNAYPLDLIK